MVKYPNFVNRLPVTRSPVNRLNRVESLIGIDRTVSIGRSQYDNKGKS